MKMSRLQPAQSAALFCPNGAVHISPGQGPPERSAGGPPPWVPGFPRQTDYRNPIVAEALKVLGYVNRFGRGVLDAQQALRENGNAPARYTFESTAVTVSAHKSKHFS
jgi:hypothetical protein